MSDFIDSIKHIWPKHWIAPGTSRLSCCIPDSQLEEGQMLDSVDDETLQEYDEGHFAYGHKQPCESCGSTFGGNRYNAHALTNDDMDQVSDPIHIGICIDCLMFHANGDEPETWTQYPPG